jgi:hypothetical protein
MNTQTLHDITHLVAWEEIIKEVIQARAVAWETNRPVESWSGGDQVT